MSSFPLARSTDTGAGAARPHQRSAAPPGLPEIPDPRTISTVDARALSSVLFRRLRTLEEGTPEYSYVRNTLVELNLSLVKFAVGRFPGRSEPMEDLVQVGTVGLIKAINRFDVAREVEFTSFALPTIVGEIKRFFRDTSWAVRVPRRLQELRLDLAKAYDVMEQDVGRAPTAAELADRLGISEAEVVEGQRAANGYAARSIEPLEEDDSMSPLARRLGVEDPALDVIECLECLKPLIAGLPERERTILSLRFGDELTQSEIGERLGISQMHVSRLLARVLAQLREGLLADDGLQEGTADPAVRPLLPGEVGGECDARGRLRSGRAPAAVTPAGSHRPRAPATVPAAAARPGVRRERTSPWVQVSGASPSLRDTHRGRS